MHTEPLATYDPRSVGPWQLIGRIGSGGMGLVYLGRRNTRGRTQEAAVKVIPEYLLGRSTALARFRREIAVLISLDDPGVARVVAADLDEDPPWYAADLIDGPTLAHRVQTEGPVPAWAWPSVALTLASTLTRLHARGIIHRDLKPHNIVLGPAGPVIIDFGISAVMGSTSLTETGDSPRTELWASPEQLRNEESTTATDIFATGTLLAWAATGIHPFAPEGEYHREGLIAAILTAPRLDGLPAEAQAWIAPMLAKAPHQRPTALEVVESVTDVSVAEAIDLARSAQSAGWMIAARGWWQVAADAGDSEGFFELGNLAAAESDEAAARTWYRLAAEAGHAEAARRVAEASLTAGAAFAGRPPWPASAAALSGANAPDESDPQGLRVQVGPAPIVDDASTAVGDRSADGPLPHDRPRKRRRRAWALALLVLAVLGVAVAQLWPNLTGGRAAKQVIEQPMTSSTRPFPIALDGDGPAAEVLRLAVGESSACVITKDRRASCWGSNAAGQLGSPGSDADAPRAVEASGLLDGVRLDRIAVGSAHVCALDLEGRAYCWGSNSRGQLGVEAADVDSSDVPLRPDPRGVLEGRRLRFIGAAGNTSCALDYSGALFCWGDNSSGQLGNGSTISRDSPVRVDTSEALGGRPLVRFGVGGDHTCAVDARSAAYCWGANDHGQLGNGTRTPSKVPVKVDPPLALTENDYGSVNLGAATTCARTRSGRALCWGSNEQGQLGTGTGPDADTPQLVESPRDALPIVRVIATGPTACSASQEGRVFCWGDNSLGQLGNGSTSDSSDPVAVVDPLQGSLPPLPLIAAGPTTTCGAATDGRAWCWGSNAHGLLGAGTGQ